MLSPFILDCVAEEDRAFARMRFSGMHTGLFRGYAPSGKPVHWLGAAWFRFERGVIGWLGPRLRGDPHFVDIGKAWDYEGADFSRYRAFRPMCQAWLWVNGL